MDTSTGVVGRKAVSTSAVDKLKKKKKKKRKSKEDKRSSASSGSPDSDGRTRLHKSRSALSCPPNFNQSKNNLLNKQEKEAKEIPETFNETLRWLPFIATHSSALPPVVTNSRLYGPTVSRLNTNCLTETQEEEEERLAIYKMNRRKRYLAAQQALLDLYPDTAVYASEERGRGESRRIASKTSIFSSPSNESLDPAFPTSTKTTSSFELAVPPIVTSKDSMHAREVV